LGGYNKGRKADRQSTWGEPRKEKWRGEMTHMRVDFNFIISEWGKKITGYAQKVRRGFSWGDVAGIGGMLRGYSKGF